MLFSHLKGLEGQPTPCVTLALIVAAFQSQQMMAGTAVLEQMMVYRFILVNPAFLVLVGYYIGFGLILFSIAYSAWIPQSNI